MFGGIFNQKKEKDDQTPQAAQPQSAQPVEQNQSYENNGQSMQSPAAQTYTAQPGIGQAQTQTTQQYNPNPTSQMPSQPVSTQTPQPSTPGGQTETPVANTTPTTPAIKADMSALSHLDPRATQVLTHAQEETRRLHQQYIEPDQVLFGLLYDEQIFKLLAEFSVDAGQLSKEIQAKEKIGTYKGQPTLSKDAQMIFDQAYRDAKMRGSSFVSPEDLLVVSFAPNLPSAKYLTEKGLKKEAVVDKLSKTATYNYGRKTVLEKYAIDLTEEAREGKLDPVAGRDKEIDRIIHILLRRTKNNPIIIGETGVGKTAIVEGLAQKIVANAVPKDLIEKRLFQLDVAALVAGASHRGEFEERLKEVVQEVLGSSGHIILFIDEIHALMGAGEENGMNAANIIKPYLARGQLQLIGATTTTEYRKHFEKDKAFERRFQPVTAEEPSEENAFEMMKVLRPKYEKFHRVTIPDDALKESIKLSKKYIGERFLPDKAIDLLDEASSDVKLMSDTGKRGDNQVKKADIEKVVSGWTGIPITKLTEDESEKLLKLEDRIHHRMVDQEEAVVAVSEAVRRGRIGLASGTRPIASFIFLGPTGVGKTELAKTLAELLFGRDDAMARLDMSEYMEKHEVAKLIGAPPGYVGYEEGGVLTEAVRKKPYSIVLMDEIEKAHPDVFNILLQLLEDGRLTDNKGNTISFKNTIVICTSNIGSSLIQQQLSKQDPSAKKSPEELNKQFAELQKVIREELTKFLRPEVLNRFDEVVIFKPLRPEHMAGIARLAIAKTAGLLKEQGFGLQITDKAVSQLAKDGYDPVYGARPLRRLVQTAIENPIALAIISKKFVVGDTIVIDYNDDANEFVFLKGGEAQAKASLNDEQFKIILQKIAAPDSITNESDKQLFTDLHEKVVKASVGGDKLAAGILAVTAATSNSEIKVLRQQLEDAKSQGNEIATEILKLVETVAQQIQVAEKEKKALLMLVDPKKIASVKEQERFMQMHDRLTQESQNGNQLAVRILAITQTTPQENINALIDDLKHAKEQDDELATDVLGLINNEITEEAQKETAEQPVTKFRTILKQVINPLYLATPENKQKFSQLYDKITSASHQDHAIAKSILTITDITSDDDIAQLKQQLEQANQQGDPLAKEILDTIEEAIKHEEVSKVKNVLLLIANPVTAQTSDEREAYTYLHGKIDAAGQKGNQLANTILNLTDKVTDEEVTKLKEQLEQSRPQNDPVAEMVVGAIETSAEDVATALIQKEQAENTTPASANPVNQVPIEANSPAQPMQSTDQNYPFGMGQQAQPTTQPANNGMPLGGIPPVPQNGMAMNMPGTNNIQSNATPMPINTMPQNGFYQPVENQPLPQNAGPVFQAPYQANYTNGVNNSIPQVNGYGGTAMQPNGKNN
jgi:ATP-dependent Clp protease ATP-binding subunit ClpC